MARGGDAWPCQSPPSTGIPTVAAGASRGLEAAASGRQGPDGVRVALGGPWNDCGRLSQQPLGVGKQPATPRCPPRRRNRPYGTIDSSPRVKG
eukprot:scaffold44_cov411-Prasinococcus_capsulatus_cf.AAC.36